MSNRWAAEAKEKLGTMPTARLLIEAQQAALAQGHTFNQFGHQPLAELLALEDEVRELGDALRNGEGDVAVRNEIGDVIFSLLNVCRAQGVDFDAALDKFAERWLTRKTAFEDAMFAQGFDWQTMPEAARDALWVEIKQQLKTQENKA